MKNAFFLVRLETLVYIDLISIVEEIVGVKERVKKDGNT